MRLLGVDYGSRRIGLAVAETATRVALPLRQIDGRNEATRDARLVADTGTAEAADGFVVGLPLNMSGSDSEQTRLTRRFAEELARLSGKPVQLQDERLSSYAAEQALTAAGIPRSRRRPRADALAAAHILQAYLDAHPPPANPAVP